MYYSVKELKDKLSERIIGLGIDKSFLENPAFASAISEIDVLLEEAMVVGFDYKDVIVKEENGNISFDYILGDGRKYSMSISSSSPKTFSCVGTKVELPYIDVKGQTARNKSVVEKVVTIDEAGFITLTTNGSLVDNNNCERGQCNSSTWSERKYYTSDGVMRDIEKKSFEGRKLDFGFDSISAEVLLVVPRQAFNSSSIFYNNYNERLLLEREMLDTAFMIYDNRVDGIEYQATVPLKKEFGLRDMTLENRQIHNQDFVISPLSPEEIEAMIEREPNPKVAEGLRKFAKGREKYYYNSADDEHFVCKCISQSQGMSR